MYNITKEQEDIAKAYPKAKADGETRTAVQYVYYLAPEFIDYGNTGWIEMQNTDSELFELGIVHHNNVQKIPPKDFQRMFNNREISDRGLIVIK